MKAKTKRRFTVVSLLGVAMVAGLVAFVSPNLRAQGSTGVATTAVTRGDLSVTATGSGTLVDRFTYSVGADAKATLIEQAGQSTGDVSTTASGAFTTVKVDVKSGDRVSRKDRLAVVSDATGHRTAVKAPVTGSVRSVTTQKSASVGQVATIGTGGLVASVMVSEYDITDISVGQSATLTVSSMDADLNGKVQSIGQTADDSSGVEQYQVVLSVKDLPHGAKVGMSVTAEIAVSSVTGALIVPATAVTDTGDRSTVQVLQSDGTTRVVTVEVGLIGASDVEVRSGLNEGDRVVTGAQGNVPSTSNNGFPGGGPPVGAGS